MIQLAEAVSGSLRQFRLRYLQEVVTHHKSHLRV